MKTLNLRLFFIVIIVFLLTIIPLPAFIAGFRPPWMLIFILYIQFFLPNYFNILAVFFLGLYLDVLLSTVIGEHAFALILTTWFAAGKARRFNFFSMGQQMALIAVFCMFYQLIIFMIDAYMGNSNSPWMIVGATFVSLCFWPFARVLADSTLCYARRL